jgi:hypothetical protein
MLTAMALFGGAAWLVALPVLGYHQAAFGGPFRVGGTAELALFGWEHIPVTLARMVRRFLSPIELLYVAPFLVWGVIQTWREARRGAVALLAWMAVIVAFHLPYAALRMRDLLSVLPVFAIWVGVGMAGVLAQALRIRHPVWRRGMRVLALGLMIAALWGRSQVTFWLPVHAKDFQSFGYMRAEQRSAFDELADLIPADGIVGASLNGGAVTLYVKRDIARPAYWTPDDWLTFVDRAVSNERSVYLLVDGVEMQDPLAVLSARYQLRQVASLSMPYFFLGGSSEFRDVPLFEVVRATAD